MATYNTQSKFNEVADFLNAYNGMINPEHFKVRVWERDAKALIQKEPAEGYLMQGLVYRLQGRLDLALESLSNAYRLDKFSAGVSYISILILNGKFEEAEQVALELMATERADSGLFLLIISNIVRTLNKDNLIKAIKLFIPSDLQTESLLDKAKETILRIDDTLSVLEEVNVSLETYKNFWRVAEKAKNNFYNGESSISVSPQHNELGSFLVIKETLYNISIQDCLKLNDKLVEAIIEDDHPFSEYQKIVLDFMPATEEAGNEVAQA